MIDVFIYVIYYNMWDLTLRRNPRLKKEMLDQLMADAHGIGINA